MAIFWIASYPKSGNTWMRAFLANLLAPSPPVSINEFAKHLPSEAAGNWYRDYGESGIDMSRPSLEGARNRAKVQEKIARSFGQRHVILKTHNLLGLYGKVPLIRGDLTLGAIYIVRDPRDVAVSFSKHFGMTIDETIAFMGRPDAFVGGTSDDDSPGVFELLGSWKEHVRSWTSAKATLLRYEDLKADPLAGFAKAAEALGMGERREKIAQAVEFSSFEKLRESEDREGYAEGSSKAERFFREGRIGGWQEALSPAQEKAIAGLAGEMMERFGYS